MTSAAIPDLRVLVTGASRGIGLRICEALAARGAWVGMVARSARDLAAAAERIGGHPFAADVSSTRAIDDLAANVTDTLGDAPDVIVNSAGVFSIASFAETETATFERCFGVNLLAPFLVIRAFLPRMLERCSGHIVNIGSIAGRAPLAGNAAYAASKYGLRGMHEVLALELAGTGVRATLIEPAATDTALWDSVQTSSGANLPPRAGMLDAADVARATLFAIEQPRDLEISVLALRAAQ